MEATDCRENYSYVARHAYSFSDMKVLRWNVQKLQDLQKALECKKNKTKSRCRKTEFAMDATGDKE